MEDQLLKFGNLGLSALTIGLLFKFMTNHAEHNTAALKELTGAVTELRGFLAGKFGSTDELNKK